MAEAKCKEGDMYCQGPMDIVKSAIDVHLKNHPDHEIEVIKPAEVKAHG